MMIIDSTTGLPMVCDTAACAAPANFVWNSTVDGKPIRCCNQHNPMYNVAAPLPMNFTGHSLCPWCGK